MMSVRQLEQQRPVPYRRPEPKRKRVGLRTAASTFGTLACLVLFAWAACSAVNAGSVPNNTKTTTYTVQPGDTEWSIAERYQTSSEDTRDVVQWIEEHNALNGSGDLQPGQRLTVPQR